MSTGKLLIRPPSPPTDRVSPSFDSNPLRRSERIWQKNKVNKLDGVYYSVCFAKEVTIFQFDPEDIVTCNFVFLDGWQQQLRGGRGGAHHGRLHTDDEELVRVPHTQDSHSIHVDRHGADATGGRSGPRAAVVGPAAARQEDVAAGGVPRPGLRDWQPVPALPPVLPTRRPVLDVWGGTRQGAGSRSCPRERLAPPSPARRATRDVGWHRASSLGAFRGRPKWGPSEQVNDMFKRY